MYTNSDSLWILLSSAFFPPYQWDPVTCFPLDCCLWASALSTVSSESIGGMVRKLTPCPGGQFVDRQRRGKVKVVDNSEIGVWWFSLVRIINSHTPTQHLCGVLKHYFSFIYMLCSNCFVYFFDEGLSLTLLLNVCSKMFVLDSGFCTGGTFSIVPRTIGKSMLFGVFAPQELGTYLGTLFGETKLALTSK